MEIGQRLKMVLEARGKSGRSVANKVGVVPSQISKIISGTTKPSLDLLQRICDELDITMAAFFAFGEQASYSTPDQIDQILGLDADHISKIVQHAEKMNLSSEEAEALEDFKNMQFDEQKKKLLLALIKVNSLPVGDQEAIIRIIYSLSTSSRR